MKRGALLCNKTLPPVKFTASHIMLLQINGCTFTGISYHDNLIKGGQGHSKYLPISMMKDLEAMALNRGRMPNVCQPLLL